MALIPSQEEIARSLALAGGGLPAPVLDPAQMAVAQALTQQQAPVAAPAAPVQMAQAAPAAPPVSRPAAPAAAPVATPTTGAAAPKPPTAAQLKAQQQAADDAAAADTQNQLRQQGVVFSPVEINATQGRSLNFTQRALGTLKVLDDIGPELTNLGAQAAYNGLPFGLGNYAVNPKFRQADLAADEFIFSILRPDTGATITKEEMARYQKVFIPRPGDDPATLAYKTAARYRAIGAIQMGLPPEAILAMGQYGLKPVRGDQMIPPGSGAAPPTTSGAASKYLNK